MIERANWSGPYVGAYGSYVWNSTKLTRGAWSADGIGGDGAGGGGIIGYDYQIAPVGVVGVEADIGVQGTRATLTDYITPISATLAERWGFAFRARAGALISPTTLMFATAGYGQNAMKLSVNGIDYSKDFSGLQVGGGIESYVAEHTTARIEYLETLTSPKQVMDTGTYARPNSSKARMAVIYRF